MVTSFIVGKAEHQVGNRCSECWRGFPRKCCCGGMIHAEFVKESWDKVVTLVSKCDQCGDNYKEKSYEVHKPIERQSRKGRKLRRI